MILHPRLSDGLSLGPSVMRLERQVSWYCPLSHCEVQVLVPFSTPPSASTVAPLLTSQICPGGLATQVSSALASVSTPLGYAQSAGSLVVC